MSRRERQLPVRRNLELLATVHEIVDGQDRTPMRKIFANIIELGTDGLILEARDQIRVGSDLTLRVVFPGQPRGADPFSRLRCSVRKVLDDPQMLYDLEIVDLDEQSRERLDFFLARSGTSWRI